MRLHNNGIAANTMDTHRKWVRNCHIGISCLMRVLVVRSHVVRSDGKGLGYGDSFMVSPRGEMLAEAELFRAEMITAKVTGALFKMPYVWDGLRKDVPAKVRSTLEDLLKKGK